MLRLQVNGKAVETTTATLHALARELAPSADVHIVNGYQTAEDVPLQEGDSIVLIEKGVLPPKEALQAMLFARHTPKVQEKICHSKVAVLGLGGLGSAIAMMLGRTGVGHLVLVDFDVVEPSNLNRQQYTIAQLGLSKTKAMEQLLLAVNPYLTITTHNVKVTPENVVDLVKDCHVVCEAFDKPQTKAEVCSALLRKLPEVPIVAGSGMAGYGSANTIQTRRSVGKLYLCGDGKTAAEIGRGLMAPRVTVCAAHQANMILRLLLGETTP